MSSRPVTCRIKDYIQPFERCLALQELRALASAEIVPVDGDEATATIFEVPGATSAESLRRALAYWHSVGAGSDSITLQLRGEATSIVARNGPAVDDVQTMVRSLVPLKLPNKRCLRYATHGLHEYRGKFFPQLVRALMNIAQVPEDGNVLDPMCGSGTTLVEACLAGHSAYGLDMNPLSVFISEVKCHALALEPSALIKAYELLRKTLAASGSYAASRSYFASLPETDQTYLARWFAPNTLEELDCIEAAIQRLPTLALQNFYSVSLSNILRRVSWQKNDDLRTRKDVVEVAEGEGIALFMDEALRATKIVSAFLSERGKDGLGRYFVWGADARRSVSRVPELVENIDAVITSPPYATALPYLDTDRLSLIYLGLLHRDGHRERDTQMIGNREITDRGRKDFWSFYEENKKKLPEMTGTLIERIDRLNKNGSVGFRRRNLAALLSKYFFDMREVIGEMMTLLRPGGLMFVVIGNNRTMAGGEPIEIRTADHLEAIAKDHGFRVVDNLGMEMLASRDIFRKNAVPSEQILTLEKP